MRRSRFNRIRRGVVLVSSLALSVVTSAAPGATSYLSTEQTSALGATGVSEPVQEAVTSVVSAFRSFQQAAAPLADGAQESELTAVATARESLLDAAMQLETAVAAAPRSTAAASAVGPCGFDLVGVANSYTVDCPVIIDVGGDDRYTNNAGGANGGGAALIDLAGNDAYTSTRSGANGGGVGGAGFLYDGGGQDTYSAGAVGTNWGRLLLRARLPTGSRKRQRPIHGGELRHERRRRVARGRTPHRPGGSDSYSATYFGVNGGSDSGASGLLIDAGGTDAYSDQEACTGSGTDRTVVPKGLRGAQLDSTTLTSGRSGCLPQPPEPPTPTPLGSVAGKVADAQTKAALPAAIVDCGGLQTAGVTLVDGRYVIPLVPAGSHRCTARVVGYGGKSQSVTVTQGAPATADFALRKER